MAEVGDRIRLVATKVDQASRTGVVTRVRGRMITVRWETGVESVFVPAAGTLTVLGKAAPQARLPRSAPTARAAPRKTTTKTASKKTPANTTSPRKSAKKAAPRTAATKSALRSPARQVTAKKTQRPTKRRDRTHGEEEREEGHDTQAQARREEDDTSLVAGRRGWDCAPGARRPSFWPVAHDALAAPPHSQRQNEASRRPPTPARAPL